MTKKRKVAKKKPIYEPPLISAVMGMFIKREKQPEVKKQNRKDTKAYIIAEIQRVAKEKGVHNDLKLSTLRQKTLAWLKEFLQDVKDAKPVNDDEDPSTEDLSAYESEEEQQQPGTDEKVPISSEKENLHQ